MDLALFRNLVYDPARTSADLQRMRRNAIADGKLEFAAVAKETLDRRFPGWDKVSYRKGGPTPTTVFFGGVRHEFPSAKEADVWLISRFVKTYPELFIDLNWETVFVVKGKKRNYFGRSPAKMFHHSHHLAEDSNNYIWLVNGWSVNLNLSNAQKRDILGRFAHVANLKYGEDWQWKVSGEPEPLSVSEI